MRRFHDRADAGRLLAAHLHPWQPLHPVVVAVMPDGLPVAAEVAAGLGAPLDASPSRQDSHRFDGCLTLVVADAVLRVQDVAPAVTDVRRRGARAVVVASPAMSPRAASEVRPEVDELVALEMLPTWRSPDDAYSASQPLTAEEVDEVFDAAGTRLARALYHGLHLDEPHRESPLHAVPPLLDTAATHAVEDDPEIAGLSEPELVARIDELRRRRHAVIAAHNYQPDGVQDVADVVGDSLELARFGAETDAEVVVLAGVRFMAETAAVLAPHRRVLIPEPEAGCSLADSVTARDVVAWRAEHPDGVVVAYVNCDATVKAEVDVCCTSANAEAVVASVPADVPLLFLPDRHLGRYVQERTGRAMDIWPGECHVHRALGEHELQQAVNGHPGADILLHPESPAAADFAHGGRIAAGRVVVASTGGMVRHAARCHDRTDLVATELGILHRLRRENPHRVFVPVCEDAVCSYMKATSLAKVYRALRDDVYAVTVPADVAARARSAVERMLAVR